MATTNPVVNELLTLSSAKRAELHELKQRYEHLLDELEKDIDAIERTLELYKEGIPVKEEVTIPVNIDASQLRGRTQKEAYDYIADKSGGRVKVNVAKRLFIEAGLSKGQRKYVYGHIYNMLKNDDRYEKAGEGEFIRTPSKLPVDSATDALNGSESGGMPEGVMSIAQPNNAWRR